MSASPDFQRFRRAVMLEGEPDRVPLAELMVEEQVKEAFLGRPIKTVQDDIDFWVQAGYDFVPVSTGLRSMIGPDLDKSGRRFKAAKTSVHEAYSSYGDGYSQRAWAAEGKGIITSHEEFEAFPWPTLDEFDFSVLDDLKRLLPPGMKAVAVVGYIFTTCWEVMGLENFCLTLIDDPSLIQKLFDKVSSIQRQVFDRVIEHDAVGAVWMPDDLAYSEDVILSPDFYRKYLFPHYREMGKICKQRDLPYILHSDGNLWKIMGDIRDCGFNAIHPIEPKAMDIRQLKKELGDKLCFIGNLDLGGVFTMGTPDQVRETTKGLIRDVGPGGGYCVGSSNSVTEYVPLENYNAMRETVLECGDYPISLP